MGGNALEEMSTPLEPARDCGKHELYRAYAQQPVTRSVVPIAFFLESGSIPCWISEDLATKLTLQMYRAPRAISLTGIGAGDYDVTHYVVLHLFFVSTPGCNSHASPAHSGRVSIVCGIVPCRIFLAELTLGRQFQRAMQTVMNQNGSVTFLSLPAPITLVPLSSNPSSPAPVFTTGGYQYDYLTGFDIDIHDYVVGDFPVFLASSTEQQPSRARFSTAFPQVFDLAGKKVARPSVIPPHIDTGPAATIRIPPRRYSLPQQAALTEFVASGLQHGILPFVAQIPPGLRQRSSCQSQMAATVFA